MENTDVPDAPGPDEEPAIGRVVDRLLGEAEKFMTAEAEATPVLTLPACGHMAMLPPHRALCDACDAD